MCFTSKYIRSLSELICKLKGNTTYFYYSVFSKAIVTWKLKTYVRWSTDNEIWLKNNLLFRSTTDWWTFDWWLHGVMTDKREKPTQLQYTCICFTLRALRSAVECVKIEGKNLEAIKCLNKCVTDSFMPCTVYNLSWGETKPI